MDGMPVHHRAPVSIWTGCGNPYDIGRTCKPAAKDQRQDAPIGVRQQCCSMNLHAALSLHSSLCIIPTVMLLVMRTRVFLSALFCNLSKAKSAAFKA